MLLTALMAMLSACGGGEARATDAQSAGWLFRFDAWEKETDAARFTFVDGDLSVKRGDNVTLWHPDRRVDGAYRLTSKITIEDFGLHPHGAGITLGGRHVETDAEEYVYFLVRGDGQFLIKTRKGEETTDVVAWTAHAAIGREDDNGVSENALMIEANPVEVRFFVNGKLVHTAERRQLQVDGMYGFRLVHDLQVRFGAPVVEGLDQ